MLNAICSVNVSLRCAVFASTCILLAAVTSAAGQQVAFPGAEGAGRYASGGRGGDVYYVENLDDSGPGSLRFGIDSASGPRTILFNVGGTIHLQSNLDIGKPNLTIAGQSAPGGGITIADRMTRVVNTESVIVQYVRFRVGDTYTRQVDSDYEPDGLWVANSRDVMIDHISASWGIDEVVSVTHGSENVTVQWSTITEALHNGGHSKGDHGYGSLINGGDITYHHNLYANNRSRNPRPGGSSVAGQLTRLDFINNVIANPGDRYGYSGGDTEELRLNFVGNYGIDGPNTTAGSLFHSGSVNTHIHHRDNVRDANDNGLLDGVATSGLSGAWTDAVQRFDLPGVTSTDARSAYIQVLSRAGASYARDAVDRRIVRQIMNQPGSIDFHIDSQNDVGGWPTLMTGAARTDSNGDGVPDDYAVAHGYGASAAIGQQVAPNGYTWLENYLHSLTPSAAGPVQRSSVAVSTAYGRGGDAQVSENTTAGTTTSSGDGSDSALNVRFSSGRNEYTLLKFDLAAITPGSVADARLELTAFHDFSGTHQIKVYGLEHDAADWDWAEQSVRFDSAPALEFDADSSTRGLDLSQVLVLGTFDASDAVAGETVVFDNASLAVFLNLASYFAEQDGVVTLLLERISDGSFQSRFASADAITLANGYNPLGATTAGAYAPRLVLDAVHTPEPSTTAAIVGAGVLLLRRRRARLIVESVTDAKNLCPCGRTHWRGD